jgi:hypothetical protein
MREVDLLPHFEVMTAAEADGGGRPLADPVHGQHHRLLERRGKEGARGMALMVLGEEETPLPIEGGSIRFEPLLQQGLLE